MIHLTKGGTDALAHSTMPDTLPAPATPPRPLDHDLLRSGIADRRQRFAELEANMVAICECAALCGADRGARIDHRETSDRAMWQRYLAAATQIEPDFMPEMLRLLSEIDRLQRLLMLPVKI